MESAVGVNALLSVVIPAHDESALLGRLLVRLLSEDPDGRLEIVVVANGCTDDTASVARGASPRVRVVETPEASKIAALNLGDRAASTFPRAYVDADVRISTADLVAVASALSADAGRMVASPAFTVDARRSTWLVRQYYRVWGLSEYRRQGHIGSGVYVLSRQGRERFSDFPDVIADDRFVQTRFAPDERLTVTEATFSVDAPRTFRALLRRSTRIALGNLQLGGGSARTGAGRLFARVARRPRLWLAFPVYAFGFLVARRRARRLWDRGELSDWHRDETTRVAG